MPDRGRVRRLAKATIEEFRRWRAEPDALERGHRAAAIHVARLHTFLESRRVPEAFDRLVRTGGWSGYLASVFLSFRDRRAVLDYLRFQESAEAPQPDDPFVALSRLLGDRLHGLGKRPKRRSAARGWAGLGGRTRLFEPIDPFVTIRRIYRRLLRTRGRVVRVPERLADLVDGLRLRVQTGLLVRSVRRRLARGTIADCGTLIAAIASELCDTDGRWSSRDRERLACTIENFVVEEAWPLLRRTKRSLWLDGGAGRFAKLAIGTMLACATRHQAAGQCEPDAVADAVRRAFFWGLTYPLVDDVLDQASSSASDRRRLADSTRAALHDDCDGATASQDDDEPIAVAMRRLLALPGVDRERVAPAIEAVLDAHVEGALPRLESTPRRVESFVWLALEKSLLVRAATAEICGFRLAWHDYVRMAPIAYFNQLGDDIWDAAEDLRDGSVNPVTAWLTGATSDDPYLQYADFGAWLADSRATPDRARGVALALVHTFGLAIAAGSAPADRLLAILGPGFRPEILRNVPHIDPDSILFELERLAVEALPRAGGSR